MLVLLRARPALQGEVMNSRKPKTPDPAIGRELLVKTGNEIPEDVISMEDVKRARRRFGRGVKQIEGYSFLSKYSVKDIIGPTE